MDEPTFRRRSRDQIFDGYAIALVVDTIESAAGRVFTRDIVLHRGAVVVVPLHDDGTVTMVRQWRAAIGSLSLEFPAGLRDVQGEDPEVTAQRELEEEAGLRSQTLTHLIDVSNSPGFTDQMTSIYLARDLSSVPPSPMGEEEQTMTIERHRLIDLIEARHGGPPVDATTVLAALMVARQLDL